MPSWSVVATVKAPAEKIMAFAAYHLSLGAAHVFLYFDDPEDPAHDAFIRHARVTPTRCTEDYWTARGGRHERHQNRQSRNARDAYGRCRTDWLTHIDVDEFLLPDRPVADILAGIAADTLVARLEPFEAMHDPSLPDDICTAHQFRGALRAGHQHLRPAALGPYDGLFPDGLLSHSNGKVIFRTGIKGLAPRIHSVFLHGTRFHAPGWHPEMKLLHFHAQDREAWHKALPFRLTRGAYMYRPGLQAFLQDATPDDIETFYQRTQVVAPEAVAALKVEGRMIGANLGLRARVQALRDGAFDPN